jgi:hypothetical protein
MVHADFCDLFQILFNYGMRKLTSEALSVKQIYLYKVSVIGTCLPMTTDKQIYMFSKINHKTIMQEEDRWGNTLNGTNA